MTLKNLRLDLVDSETLLRFDNCNVLISGLDMGPDYAKNEQCLAVVRTQWQIQEFPDTGAPIPRGGGGGANPSFGQFLAQLL